MDDVMDMELEEAEWWAERVQDERRIEAREIKAQARRR